MCLNFFWRSRIQSIVQLFYSYPTKKISYFYYCGEYDCRVAINAKIQFDWQDFLLCECRLELLFILSGLIRLSAIKNVKKEVKKNEEKKFEEVVDGEDRIIDLPNGRFIGTNDWDLSDEEIIAMADDSVCYCPICNKNNNH